MTPEEFIPYLKGILDSQTEETPLVKLLKKKVAEVRASEKFQFPPFEPSRSPVIVPLRQDETLPASPITKPYCGNTEESSDVKWTAFTDITSRRIC